MTAILPLTPSNFENDGKEYACIQTGSHSILQGQHVPSAEEALTGGLIVKVRSLNGTIHTGKAVGKVK